MSSNLSPIPVYTNSESFREGRETHYGTETKVQRRIGPLRRWSGDRFELVGQQLEKLGWPDNLDSMVVLKSQKRRIAVHDEVTSAGKRGFEESEVVSGCPTCRKRISTMGQFLNHLANDVIPESINRLSAGNGRQETRRSFRSVTKTVHAPLPC